MFMTAQLNMIPYLLEGQEWSGTVRKKLERTYLDLEAALLRAKVLREFSRSRTIYLIQSHIHACKSELGYLFAPFILSNLNKTTIYTTPASETVLSILNKYYQAEKKPVYLVDDALEALKMYIELSDPTEDKEIFFYTHLIKALCRTDISTVFLITEYQIDKKKLQVLTDFLKVDIYVISISDQQAMINSEGINMSRLLFKNKDSEHTKLCTLFSQKNAELLIQMDSLSIGQSTHLIEDMFYSEHIYEKLSVYAEYIQTRIQHSNIA